MNAKCLLLLVATVVLALASVGCQTVRAPRSGDAQLLIWITASETGEITTILMDKNGKELPRFAVDSGNHLKAILERYKGKQIIGGGPLTISVLRGSEHCVVGCWDGACGECE